MLTQEFIPQIQAENGEVGRMNRSENGHGRKGTKEEAMNGRALE